MIFVPTVVIPVVAWAVIVGFGFGTGATIGTKATNATINKVSATIEKHQAEARFVRAEKELAAALRDLQAADARAAEARKAGK